MASFGDGVKRSFKKWTLSMTAPEFEGRLSGSRSTNEYGVDPFGFSLDYALSAIGPILWLYKNYFRVETHGIENVPQGRVLLIANHSGQLPIDAAMIGIAMLTEAPYPRPIRSMIEKWVVSSSSSGVGAPDSRSLGVALPGWMVARRPAA